MSTVLGDHPELRNPEKADADPVELQVDLIRVHG